MKTTFGQLAFDGVLEYSDGYRTKKDELAEGGFRILRVTDVHDGWIGSDGQDYVDSSYESKIGQKFAREGDILLTTKGTIGRIAVVPDLAGENLVYSPQLCFFRVRDLKALDPRFLRYWLASRAATRQIGSLSASTDMAPYLSLRDIRTLEVDLPDLATQRAIGEVLGVLDDKIAANRQIIEASVELAMQTVAREAVGPDRPLSEIADVQMGSSPRGADLNEDGDGMEFYQGVRDFGELSPSPRVFATINPRRAAPSDTLLAVRAPVGEVNWARRETCIGRGLAAVRSADTPTTVHYLLRRFANRWDEHEGSGTVFSSVTGPQVKEMRFPTVPEASASEVEQLLASVHQRALSAEAEGEGLARTRDELLPLLMNGRITVEDAERAVEGVV